MSAPALAEAPQSDTAEAVRFCRALRPEGTVCLVAIIPDGGTEAATFDTVDADGLARWIEARQGLKNLYFTVNPTHGRPTKKPTKDDIAASAFLWVDLDPVTAVEEQPDGLRRERERLARLARRIAEDSPTPPAFVIDSGNGFNLLWRRADSHEVDGKDSAATILAEELGRLLELRFCADHVRNVDRVLRLPGTINIPNKTKRAKGRGVSISRLVTSTDRAVTGADVRALCAWGALPDAEPELRARLTAELAADEALLRRWLGETTGLSDPSRSGMALSMASLLHRRGFDRAEIGTILHGWDAVAGADLSERQLDRMVTKATAAPSASSRFRLTGAGVEKHIERQDKETGATRTEWRWFCSRLEIVADTRSHVGEDWGRLLRITDRDGTVHEWAMPMTALAGDGTALREALLSRGLDLAPGRFAREALAEYVATARPTDKARCVSRIGWHGKAFILPDGAVGDTEGERVLLQTVAPLDHAFRQAGTLEGWQQHVARYAAGNSRLTLALSAAFAAPLVHLTGAESGGFHLRGASSTGKTTALVVAGSAWGGGGVKGYKKQWRATDNGLEGTAVAHCDALLCLDEISQIAPQAAGAAAYMLANGAGKVRAGRGGEARSVAEWRTLFLSSGEIGIADKLAEDGRGRRAAAGQQVRVLDIPADAGAGMGLFEDLHGFPDADTFARHLNTASWEHFGHAARAFLAIIAANPTAAASDVASIRTEFLGRFVPAGAGGQVSRAATRFALLAAAGEMAAAYGVVPWQWGETVTQVGKCFLDWLEARGGAEPEEDREAVATVRRFLEAHGKSRFEAIGDLATDFDADITASAPYSKHPDRPVFNRVGFRRYDAAGAIEYLILPEAWKAEVCAGLDPLAVAKTLARKGYLVGQGGKLQNRARLPGFKSPARVYLVSSNLMEG